MSYKANWLTLSDAVIFGIRRPSKLTEALIEEFRLVLSRCFYLETACNYLGISRNSVAVWRRRGKLEADRMAAAETDKCKPSEVLYVKFYYMYLQAIATAKINANGVIIDAALSGTWQAAAWHLERRHPERYAKNRNEIKELVKTTAAQAGEISELRDNVADLIANLKASLGTGNPRSQTVTARSSTSTASGTRTMSSALSRTCQAIRYPPGVRIGPPTSRRRCSWLSLTVTPPMSLIASWCDLRGRSTPRPPGSPGG